MKKIIGIGIVLTLVIVPVVCVGGTYIFLKEDFEEKQMGYETDISKWKEEYEDLTQEVVENNDSRLMYEKLMLKGIRKNIAGVFDYGYATADFYDAGYRYDESDFEWAIYFFNSCDATFAFAMTITKKRSLISKVRLNMHRMNPWKI